MNIDMSSVIYSKCKRVCISLGSRDLFHYIGDVLFRSRIVCLPSKLEADKRWANENGPGRNSANAPHGHHRRWTASINRINVISRSGWTGTKRPWWRPRLRAFRLRPLALARIKTWKPSSLPPLTAIAMSSPAREKKRDQNTLSPNTLAPSVSTDRPFQCRFRRTEVVCRSTVDSDWSPLDTRGYQFSF